MPPPCGEVVESWSSGLPPGSTVELSDGFDDRMGLLRRGDEVAWKLDERGVWETIGEVLGVLGPGDGAGEVHDEHRTTHLWQQV